jgi:hypothetical protein
MKVISHFQGNYPDDPVRMLGFEDFSDKANDCLLFIGCLPDPSIKEPADVPKYLLCLEEQLKPEVDGSYSDPYDLDSYLPYVDKAFTIVSPNATGRKGRTNVFFPFNEKYIPEQTEKLYDVIYTGFVNIPHVRRLANIISNYNYRYVSFALQNGLETNLGVSYVEKLKLVSQSKISIIHNMLSYGTPQLKSRTFEAAFSRTLMLVLKDKYNVIEEWFVENEDFIYFESEEDLQYKLDSILENYSDYQNVIDNAYNKAINEYTTEKFVEKYIGFKK